MCVCVCLFIFMYVINVWVRSYMCVCVCVNNQQRDILVIKRRTKRAHSIVYKIDLLNCHQIDISIFSEVMACARSLARSLM